MITFIIVWTVISFPCGILFCWLLKTKCIGIEVIDDDPNEFVHDWLERRQ